jgi:hypothetical protein
MARVTREVLDRQVGPAQGAIHQQLRGRHGALGYLHGPCRFLNLSTSMGGTRSKVEGGDRHDLEPAGTHGTQDTRFIQVRAAGVATLRPV